MRSLVCLAALLAAVLLAAPTRVSAEGRQGQRKLLQTVNWAAGTKFGPPENYFTLRSQGGPYSSIAGTRTTTAKAGSPPRPPVYQFSYDSKRSDTPAPKDEKKSGGRRLSQTVNWAAGTKFGPPENYFTLRSQGGPYSSIAGTRTTTAKAGSPPRPPVYQFSYDSKRSDTPAPEEEGKKGSGRKLAQTINWAAGTKFGPPENYFTLRSQGGPYSSIAGTRTTTVKAGSPPRPPVYQFSYDSKRSDTPAPKEGA